jgi:hypothetical protein
MLVRVPCLAIRHALWNREAAERLEIDGAGPLTASPWGWLGIAALGLLGIVLIVFPTITHGMMPGDLADARFNEYVLEHLYRWIAGKTASFWSADFFYPFPLTIAFSDSHLGEGWVFVALRGLGFDREDAFRGWYLVGFIVNFAACAFVLRRLGYSALATGAGAFLFTFGLPITAQESHAQLIYRFGVPLSVLGLIEFGGNRRLGPLAALVFWTVWQFYCSIYVGYFLSLLLIALAIAFAVSRNGLTVAALAYWPDCFRQAWKAAPARRRLLWMLGVLLLIGLLGAFLAQYAETGALYGFRRSTQEIDSMLPRPASYLYATTSRLWRSEWRPFQELPMRHEQAMFVGVAPFLAIAAGLFLRWRRRASADPYFPPMLGALVLVAIATLFILDHSFYRLFATAPGVNAIRVVTRIIVVLLFPFAVLLASGLDSLMPSSMAGPAWRLLAVGIAALTVFESAFVRHYVSTKQAWLDRLTNLEALLPPTLPDAPILMVGKSTNGPDEASQIDAMLLAQQRGWQTLDGYSASSPPGYTFTTDCSNAARNIVAGLKFLGRNTDKAYQALAVRTVRIGYGDCDSASLTQRPRLTSFAGPLPAETIAKTAIEITGIQVKNGAIHVALLVRTTAPGGIPYLSTTGMPIRLSARYLDPNTQASDALHPNEEWKMRQDLVVDITPDMPQPIDLVVPLPAAAGTYRIGVTLVQEAVTWFHDRGMPIAISRQTVTMDGGIKIGE